MWLHWKPKRQASWCHNLSHKLGTSVQCYLVWNTKPRNPIVKDGLCTGCRCTVYHGNCLRPMCETVDYCEEVCLAFWLRKRAHYIHVDVLKTSIRKLELLPWCPCVSLCTLTTWQRMQVRAHCVTSLARPGQTNLLDTMRRVTRMEGCDSECSLSKVGRRQAGGR